MKIVVSSTGKDLDSEIDPRFGRCAYFLLVDTDTMDHEVLDNGNQAIGGGANVTERLEILRQALGVDSQGCGVPHSSVIS